MAQQQVGERGLLIVDTGIYQLSNVPDLQLSLSTQCIHVHVSSYHLSKIPLYPAQEQSSSIHLFLHFLQSPLLLLRPCVWWLVARCENCVFAASQQQIGCLSVWDRGPFYQQFHSIVKCENNKLSIQYRTDTIWISKGWFVKHKEKFLTVALSLCVGQKGALSINFALFRIRLGAGTRTVFADYLLKCKWDQNVWI